MGRVTTAAVRVVAVVGGTRPLVVVVAVTVVAVAVVAVAVAVVAVKPNRTLGLVVPAAGVDVEVEDGVEVVLGVLEEAVLEVGCMGAPMGGFSKVPVEASGNCKTGILGPILTAMWQFPWRALWKREVLGSSERLSSSRSEISSVAPPKLLVESAILAVSLVYGYILFPAVISFWDKAHANTAINP